ncbi:MYG1 family protein [uncultured Desulfuromusa sp.]|uniref:MYG1 family protein n=1 Tax=uncultured Desulfuromusa sp. TaxID=219183 RepID=UPI002AA8B363|nr:MYG1 family protein [uncultured Desulfuromusa sp.]
MYKIITHPGSAHKDDFMSVSLLLATLGDAEVYRCEPTPEDLADPDTYVVDVGMDYDLEKHNFDHHQDSSFPCAFHLLMRYLGYHDAAMIVFGWYAHMSMMDVRGPYRTAQYLGVDTSVLFASSSPIDGYILSCFSKVTSLTRTDAFYGLMKEFGEDFIAMVSQKMARLEQLKKETKILPVKHLKALFSRIGDNPKLSMELYLRDLADDDIAISITPSVRGAGWEILRLGDNLLIDFRSVATHPEIRFVHANGFMAKTKSLIPLEAVLEIASQAIGDS